MDMRVWLGVKFYGEKSFNLMKIIELEDHNYTEKAEGFRGFDGKKFC